MNLLAYLKKKKLTQKAFADLAGIAQSRVSQLVTGRRPSLQLAEEIEALTGGKVKVSDWRKE